MTKKKSTSDGKFFVGKMLDITKSTFEDAEWEQLKNLSKGVNVK